MKKTTLPVIKTSSSHQKEYQSPIAKTFASKRYALVVYPNVVSFKSLAKFVTLKTEMRAVTAVGYIVWYVPHK